MSFNWRLLSPFHSRGFRFLVCFTEAGASMPQVPQGRDEGGLLGFRARDSVAVALAHWRRSEGEGDEQRRLAFVSLRAAIALAPQLDVRLYLYLHSDEAAMLYQAYEREVIE